MAPGTAGQGDPAVPRAGPGPGRQRPRRPTPATILVRVDWDSLVRGHPMAGERCEMAGVGPVPVSVVEEMMASGDAFLVALLTKGADVVNVAHLGRRPTAAQRSALLWRDPTCRAEGCNAAVRLEMDHRTQWADTRITLAPDMDLLCGHHHDLKTHKGWALVEGAGSRPMVPPDDPRHPANGAMAPHGVGGPMT